MKLKKKYGLAPGDSTAHPPPVDNGYVDRAEERRKVHGSDNPYEKTEQANMDTALSEGNKGFKMLAKMGWKGGGLGKSADGIAEPIKVEQRAEKAGLGTDRPAQVDVPKRQKQKADIWIKTQKRFVNTPVLSAFQPEEEEEVVVVEEGKS